MLGGVIGRTLSLTQLFRRMRQGDRDAATLAYQEAYEELRTIARRLVRHEAGDHVAATELVNETYLRHLRRGTILVENRQHFYSIAAKAMRNVLIDLARERKAKRRGNGGQALPIEYAREARALASTPEEMLSLDTHLIRLERLDPAAGRVFSLRFFLGYTAEETAELLSMEPKKLRNDWEYAKAWLRDQIDQDLSGPRRRRGR